MNLPMLLLQYITPNFLGKNCGIIIMGGQESQNFYQSGIFLMIIYLFIYLFITLKIKIKIPLNFYNWGEKKMSNNFALLKHNAPSSFRVGKL